MKNAIVTGASRGIGAAIANALGRDGYHVALCYAKSGAAAERIAKDCGGTAFQADVSEESQVRRMFDEIGDAEVLVCNAGISHYGLFSETDINTWRRLFEVNVDGVYNCIQAALPGMLKNKRGAVIIISSVWGVTGASCEAAYSATKSALVGLTKSLAKELGPSGIRVNCIAPGVIETDMLNGFSMSDKNALAEQTPLCRLGAPEDVAELAAFLCSEKAAFITGQIIGVDGGFGV